MGYESAIMTKVRAAVPEYLTRASISLISLVPNTSPRVKAKVANGVTLELPYVS